MDLKVTQGKTIRLPADFYSGSKRVDPVDPRVKVVNAKGVAVVRDETPERDSRGVYHYDFKVDPDAPLGIWQAIWTARIDDRGVSGSDPFEVLPAAAAGAEVQSPPRASRSPGGAPGTAAAGRAAAAGAAASSAAGTPAARDAGRQSAAAKRPEAGRGPQAASPTSQKPARQPGDPPRTGNPAPAAPPPAAAASTSPSMPISPKAQAGSPVRTPSPSQGRRAPEAGPPSRVSERGVGRAEPSGSAPKAPPAGGKAAPGSSVTGSEAPPGSRPKESVSGKAGPPAKAPKAAVPAAAAAVAADPRRGEGRTGFDADVDGRERKVRPFGRKAARDPDEAAAQPAGRGSRLSRGQALLIAGALGIVLLAIWLSPRRSDTVQSKIDQGVAAQKAGRTDEAERLYQEVLRSDPENKLANFNLGVSAHRAGRTEEAEVLYKKSLEADPVFLPALFNLAILQENTGRNEESEATYRRILEEYPDNGPAHLNLGFLLTQKLSRPEEGRAAFARAIELDESLAARIPAELRPPAPAGPPAP